jgi:hypothetical protein
MVVNLTAASAEWVAQNLEETNWRVVMVASSM